jgi:hypothetical protein
MKKLVLLICYLLCSLLLMGQTVIDATVTATDEKIKHDTIVQEVRVVEKVSTKAVIDEFGVGIRAGANFSNVYDDADDNFDTDGKLGFAGGVFLTLPLGRILGVQPEILFSQKGFSASGTLNGDTYNFTRTLNYFDVPLQVQLKPFSFLAIVGGPQFSFLLSRTDVFESGTITYQQQQDIRNDDIRRNTLGAIGGADLYLGRILISGRISWDLQDNYEDGSVVTPRYKNVFMQATVGYKL